MGRSLALFLAALVCCAPIASAQTGWTGQWRGHATDNRGDSFDITVRIYDDGGARLAYDGQFLNGPYHCDALLLANGATRGARLYREAIIDGRCLNGADVSLALRQGELVITWTGEEEGALVTYDTRLAHR